jgi:glucose uptake protein GlcU
MGKGTVSVVIFLIGLVLFLQSFDMETTKQTVYLITGIILMIGGLVYGKYSK